MTDVLEKYEAEAKRDIERFQGVTGEPTVFRQSARVLKLIAAVRKYREAGLMYMGATGENVRMAADQIFLVAESLLEDK